MTHNVATLDGGVMVARRPDPRPATTGLDRGAKAKWLQNQLHLFHDLNPQQAEAGFQGASHKIAKQGATVSQFGRIRFDHGARFKESGKQGGEFVKIIGEVIGPVVDFDLRQGFRKSQQL